MSSILYVRLTSSSSGKWLVTHGTHIRLMKNCRVHKKNKFEDYKVAQ